MTCYTFFKHSFINSANCILPFINGFVHNQDLLLVNDGKMQMPLSCTPVFQCIADIHE